MSEPGKQEGRPEAPRKLDVFRRDRDLSKFEHAVLLGSGVGDYNWAKFKEEADQKKLSPDALKPVGWQFPTEQRQVQNIERIRGEQRQLVGAFPFLDEHIDELPSDYQVYVQPVGLIDPDTGNADPIWRVSIVDKDFNPVTSKALGDLIRLTELHTPYLHLEGDGPGAKLLHLNDELQ